MSKSILQITYLGHATVLIRLGEVCFLTDPNFSNKVLFGKTRFSPLSPAPEKLPLPDAILVSRSNYEHLDLFTYKYFKTLVPIIVPKGLGKFVGKFLPNPIVEIPRGGRHRHGEVTIHAVPTPDHGHRLFPFRYRASTAYLLQGPAGVVFFAGDGRYHVGLQDWGKRFAIDVALLPVELPRRKTKGPHKTLSPAGAIQTLIDLKARHLIPIRWGTFDGKGAERELLKNTLQEEAARKGVAERLHILEAGENFLSAPSPLS
jgi:L-ascorbate metabolism protein UlaG (beta-lactamase superfamily)